LCLNPASPVFKVFVNTPPRAGCIAIAQRIGLSPRKPDSMGLSDYQNFAISLGKSDSPQPQYQPHQITSSTLIGQGWVIWSSVLRLLRFCVLGSGAEPGHGSAIFGSCNPSSSADRKNKVLVMGLYFRVGANPI
jgi:hypothetical protein